MNSIFEQFLNKECLVYTVNGNYMEGILISAENGWLTLKSFKNEDIQAVNCEYITRIRDYPKNSKTGKRKDVIWD